MTTPEAYRSEPPAPCAASLSRHGDFLEGTAASGGSPVAIAGQPAVTTTGAIVELSVRPLGVPPNGTERLDPQARQWNPPHTSGTAFADKADQR
jgi:hypothetical protein